MNRFRPRAGEGTFPRRAPIPPAREPGAEPRPAPPRPRWVRPFLLAAAALSAGAVFLPLWGMTLVSTQYPEGLRMVVYPTRIEGDVAEINVLNHYIGMPEISNAFFVELRLLPALLGAIALTCVAAALLRRTWATLLPLGMMGATAAFGFWSMQKRLHQFGHDLDPRAPITIEPFTPPMVGEHQIAQFATWSYFTWGTFLPVLAGVLAAAALWLQLRAGRSSAGGSPPAVRPALAALLAGLLVVSGGCGRGEGEAGPAAEARAPAAAGGADSATGAEMAGAERETARLTAGWSEDAWERCGTQLRDVLGARALVAGTLAGVPAAGDAGRLAGDARDFLAAGDSLFAVLRPRLEAGACDGAVNVALDEVWQEYVRAGTAASQAARAPGS